ncbi:MAG: hypothetical protein HYV26_02175 [Candidatus Hydrogenedentes bacterium]|nr:hypothetical protein [Candidatus Hydrogenedentota bacterium]
MAEEKKAPEAGKSSFVGTLVVIALMIVIPAVLAVAVYTFVLKPMLAEPEETTEEASNLLPETLVNVEFGAEQVTVVTDDPGQAAPILTYQVTFACKNEETAAVVEKNLAWFQAKLLELHSNRTRKELNDPFVKANILRQAKQEANALLHRLNPDPELEILEVMHLKFTVYDL